MHCNALLSDIVMKETYQIPIGVYHLSIFLSRLTRGTITVTDAVFPRIVARGTLRAV